MTETSGTYLVASADAESALLRDVHTGRVYPLSSNPGLAAADVLEATVEADPPLELTWSLAAVDAHREVAVERADRRPSERAVGAVADATDGDVRRLATADGELHVLAVPAPETDRAVESVLDDEATLERAARLGATRVVVAGADGVVSVRYRS